MGLELSRTGIRAMMDLSQFRGPANEYLRALAQMIEKNREAEKAVQNTAQSWGIQEKEVKQAAQAITAANAKHIAEVERLGRTYTSFGRNLQQVGANLSRYVTLPLLAAAGAAGKVAVDFEQKMAAIQSIGGQTGAELETLGQKFLDMSMDITQSSASALELADVFYFLQGSGFQGAEAMDVLKVAAQASQAGMVDLQSATDSLVYSLNAYGMGAEEARHFSDVLFRTVDIGVVGFDDLSSAIGLVTGNAASSGISFEELAAAMSTVSRTTKGASRAATEINMMITAMLKPTKDLDDAFKSITGHSAAWVLENEGLEAALRVVQEATGGAGEKINQLFGNVRAGRAVTSLLREDLTQFTNDLGKMQNVAGATSKAAAINIDTTAAAFTNLKNTAIAAGIDLAKAWLPTIQEIVSRLKDLINWITSLSDSQREFILVMAAVVAGLGPAISGFGTFLEILGNLKVLAAQMAGGSIKALIGAMIGPAGLVIAIGAAIVGTVLLTREINKQRDAFQELRPEIVATTDNYEEYIAATEEKMPTVLKAQAYAVAFLTGGLIDMRKELVLTRDEYDRQKYAMGVQERAIKSLGNTTEDFQASLYEGMEGNQLYAKSAQRATEEVTKLNYAFGAFAGAHYGEDFGEVAKNAVQMTEEMSNAFQEAQDEVTKLFVGMIDIIEDGEKEITKLAKEHGKERTDLTRTSAAEARTSLKEHQAELEALEKAYLAKRAELQAAGDADGLQKLNEAYSKKRSKMQQDYAQDGLDLQAANDRKMAELDRAHLEELIEQRRANQEAILEQKKKLGTTVWMVMLEEALKDGEIDEGEQTILNTLQKAFGLQLDNQLKYTLDSLALTKELAAGNLMYAKTIADGWNKLAAEQGGAADDLEAQLAAMPSPEDIMNQFDFSSAFDAIGGAADGASSAVEEADTATKSLGETVGDVTTAVNSAIEAFENLAGYETSPELRQSLQNIANDIRDAVTILVRTWDARVGAVEGEGEAAGKFAEQATTVMGAYRAAAEAFKLAAEYSKVTRQNIHDIADNINTAVGHMQWIAEHRDSEAMEDTAKFAEQVTAMLEPFSVMAEVAKAADEYSKLTRQDINDIASNINIVVGHFQWLQQHAGPKLDEDSMAFAERIAAVAGAIGDAAESLGKLTDYSHISEYRIKEFIADMKILVDNFDAPEVADEILEKAKRFAEYMEPVADVVSTGTEALSTLSGYSHEAVDNVEEFVADLEDLAMRLLVRVPWMGQSCIDKLTAFANTVKPVSDIVSDGIKAITGLRDYSSEAIENAEEFVNDIEELAMEILIYTPWMGQSCIDKLQSFANAISPASDIVSDGMDIMSGLKDYSAGAIDNVMDFMNDIRAIMAAISGQLSAYDSIDDSGSDIIESLTAFSNTVSPASSIVKDGLDILSGLQEYSGGTVGDVFSFMRDLRSVVRLISDQAKPYGQDIVDDLTEFSNAVAPASSIVKDGLDILSSLKEISSPTADDIQAFIDSLNVVLDIIKDNLPTIDKDLIAELTNFAETVAPAASIVTDGVDALVTLGEEYITAPTEEALQAFINGLEDILQILKDNLPTIDEDIITALTAFANAVEPAAKIVEGGAKALAIPKASYAPTEASIISFMNALKELIRVMSENLPTISNDIIVELTRFSDAVTPAKGIVSEGIDALEDIAEYESNTTDITAQVKLLIEDLIELTNALEQNLPTISVGLITSVTEFNGDIQLIHDTMSGAVSLLETMTGIQDFASFEEGLDDWSNAILGSLGTLLESINTFLDLDPEQSALDFRLAVENVAADIKVAVDLLSNYNGSNGTSDPFSELAIAIRFMSLSARTDLGLMGAAIRSIIRDIAALPRTVVVKFISDNTGWAPPSGGMDDNGLPNFDRGGIVPGPLGKPTLAIVHGGEIITPPATQTQYNSTRTNYEYNYNLEAHYARGQSEGSIRSDLALMQLLQQTG